MERMKLGIHRQGESPFGSQAALLLPMKRIFSFISPERSVGTHLKQKGSLDLLVEKTAKKGQARKKIKETLEEIRNMNGSFKKARNLS